MSAAKWLGLGIGVSRTELNFAFLLLELHQYVTLEHPRNPELIVLYHEVADMKERTMRIMEKRKQDGGSISVFLSLVKEESLMSLYEKSILPSMKMALYSVLERTTNR